MKDVTEWREKMRCINHPDPELFFPTTQVGYSRKDNPRIKEAKSFCNGCTVKIQCLQAAIDNGEESGVWGGELFEDERLRRKIFSRLR